MVVLCDLPRKKTFSVHVLVAIAFLGPRPSSRHVVAHFDGDGLNPRLENLRWATPEENEADKRRHGRHLMGEAKALAKCSAEIVRELRASSEPATVACKRFGVSASCVRHIRRRVTWKHVE